MHHYIRHPFCIQTNYWWTHANQTTVIHVFKRQNCSVYQITYHSPHQNFPTASSVVLHICFCLCLFWVQTLLTWISLMHSSIIVFHNSHHSPPSSFYVVRAYSSPLQFSTPILSFMSLILVLHHSLLDFNTWKMESERKHSSRIESLVLL